MMIPSPNFVPKPSPEPLTDAVPLGLSSSTYCRTVEIRTKIVSTKVFTVFGSSMMVN